MKRSLLIFVFFAPSLPCLIPMDLPSGQTPTMCPSTFSLTVVLFFAWLSTYFQNFPPPRPNLVTLQLSITMHVPVTSPVCSESRMAAVMLLLAKSRSSWSSLGMSNLPVSSSHPTEPSLLPLPSSRRNRSQLRLDRAGATN